jgi:hypothetical protein
MVTEPHPEGLVKAVKRSMNCHYQDKRVTNMDQINVIGVELLYGLDQ